LSDFDGLRCGKFRIGFPERRIRQLRSPRRRGASLGGGAPAAQEFGRARSRDSGPVRPICTGRSRARVDLAAFSHRGHNLRRLPNPEFLDADSRSKIRDR
jgi:hypothetical protein